MNSSFAQLKKVLKKKKKQEIYSQAYSKKKKKALKENTFNFQCQRRQKLKAIFEGIIKSIFSSSFIMNAFQ